MGLLDENRDPVSIPADLVCTLSHPPTIIIVQCSLQPVSSYISPPKLRIPIPHPPDTESVILIFTPHKYKVGETRVTVYFMYYLFSDSNQYVHNGRVKTNKRFLLFIIKVSIFYLNLASFRSS